MCQLLGMNCNTPTDVTFSFSGFAQRGGITDHHSDGWGIAFFEGHGVRHFVDHQSASQSPIADLIRRYPIQSRNVIAHIRKATQGVVSLENCHPFVRELWGRYWVFAHNGNLENYAPRMHGNFKPVGQTDSELAFCWLMQELASQCAHRAGVVAHFERVGATDCPTRHLQLFALQWASAVGTRQHPFALRVAPPSVLASDLE